MNETRFSLRATRTFKPIALPLVILAVSAVLVLSGCRGGSDDVPPRKSVAPRPSATNTPARTERIGVPILDAVAFSRPSEALTEPTDPTLVDYGDLLFNQADLTDGYVLDDQWCGWSSQRCVTVSGDEVVHFGGEPLEAFVLDPDYHIDNDAIEVVDLRAIHHPVSDELRVALDVKSTQKGWETRFDRVKVTSNRGVLETRLVGPGIAAPGDITHYELRPGIESVSGPVKMLVTFNGGVRDDSRVELEIDVNDSAPEIERTESPLRAAPRAAIFRSSDPLPDVEGGSEDGDQAIEALIGAMVDGADTTGLVLRNSPGAVAVAALSDAGLVVRPRRDPTNPNALCWLTSGRGAFCERWHGGITKGGALTSWSVEGTAIDTLVESRSGSMPGTSLTLVRSVITDVVLARTTVANNTGGYLGFTLQEPRVDRSGRVSAALFVDGASQVDDGETEVSSALIESSDFSFTVKYRDWPDKDDLFFYADLSGRKSQTPESSDD